MTKVITGAWQSDASCREFLRKLKFPNGLFLCPQCQNTRAYHIRSRDLLQCIKCKKQVSLTAGTFFHGIRTPLSKLFVIIENLVSGAWKSASKLAAELQLPYATVWRHLQRLRILLNEKVGVYSSIKVGDGELKRVLFRRSIESPARYPRPDALPGAQAVPRPSAPNVVSQLSSHHVGAITGICQLIGFVFHGISRKYAQLYMAQLSLESQPTRMSLRSILAICMGKVKVSLLNVRCYSSPEILTLPGASKSGMNSSGQTGS